MLLDRMIWDDIGERSTTQVLTEATDLMSKNNIFILTTDIFIKSKVMLRYIYPSAI